MSRITKEEFAAIWARMAKLDTASLRAVVRMAEIELRMRTDRVPGKPETGDLLARQPYPTKEV